MAVNDKNHNKAVLREYGVENIRHFDFPESYAGNLVVWSFDRFKKRFRTAIVKLDDMEMEFDLIGISCSMANALRRTILSEVPSMAIEKVFVANNTTFIRDEVLAHRLGLIPLKADARVFEFRPTDAIEPSDQDTLEYELKVKCTVNPDTKSSVPGEKYKHHVVYSKDIKWVPFGGQQSLLKEQDVLPVHGDILLDKLRPGQELDLKLQATKGIGRDHAKFSPVATAFYRMLPSIRLLDDVVGEAAVRLQQSFSPGVIKLEKDTESCEKKAVVANPRYDSCSRNVFRYDDLKTKVELTRVPDHFIFTIESVGALAPDVIFLEAVNILMKKCQNYIKELNIGCKQ